MDAGTQAAFPPAGCEPLSGRSPAASGPCRSRCTYCDGPPSGVGGGPAVRPTKPHETSQERNPLFLKPQRVYRPLHPNSVSSWGSPTSADPGVLAQGREAGRCTALRLPSMVSTWHPSLCLSQLLSLGRPRVPLSALLSPRSYILCLTPLLGTPPCTSGLPSPGTLL